MKNLLLLSVLIGFNVVAMDRDELIENPQSPFTKLPEDVILEAIFHSGNLSDAIALIYQLNRVDKAFRELLRERLRQSIVARLAEKFDRSKRVVNYLVGFAVANYPTLEVAIAAQKKSSAFKKVFAKSPLDQLIYSMAKMYNTDPMIVALMLATDNRNDDHVQNLVVGSLTHMVKQNPKKAEKAEYLMAQYAHNVQMKGIDPVLAMNVLKKAGVAERKKETLSSIVATGDEERIADFLKRRIDPNEGQEFSPALDIVFEKLKPMTDRYVVLGMQSFLDTNLGGSRDQIRRDMDKWYRITHMLINNGANPSDKVRNFLKSTGFKIKPKK